jgi:hypothetical protein
MVHRPNFHVLNVGKKLKSRECKLGNTTHDVWSFHKDQETKPNMHKNLKSRNL